jgi:hypothetical protein
MTETQPVLFGYQLVRVTTPQELVVNNHRRLAAFASVEGYSLGTVFVEVNASKPWSALGALIEAARRSDEVTTVVVPRVTDLGLTPLMQEATRRRLEQDAGLHVIVLSKSA